jgi:hypothetical protein
MRDSKQQQQAFLQRVKDTLDAGESQLDSDTLRDLRRARSRALQGLPGRRRIWQPVALAALAASQARVVSLHLMQPNSAANAPAVEDMNLLSAGDDLDLYENLEFYQWLALEQHNG